MVLNFGPPSRTRWAPRLTLGLLALSLLFPAVSWGKMLKYVDRDGVIHFVDDESLIPPEYRPDVRLYNDPEDDLSPKERANLKAIREREQEEQNARRREQEAKKEREVYLKSLETPVIIRENTVLVPVEVVYDGGRADLTLVLDTGATHTVVYRHAVPGLAVDRAEKSVSQLAGGILVRTYRVKFRSIKVGPCEAEDVDAFMMDHVAPESAEQGLLGMDFLSQRDYRIDYEKQLIRWAEPRKKGRE